MSTEKEIQKVRSAEIARGKKTADTSRRKIERLRSLLLDALKRGDRELFKQLLIDLGQPSESPEHGKSMEIFEASQRKP